VDFTAFVVLYGPDDFPEWRKMTWASAFSALHEDLQGVGFLGSTSSDPRVAELLSAARLAYEQKRLVEGAHLLQDLMKLLRTRC